MNGFSPKLVFALILSRSGLGLLTGKISSIFIRVICPPHDTGRVLLFRVVFFFRFFFFRLFFLENRV